MSSLNQCQFIGNLGADPEVRYTANGEAITSFRIACNERWTDKATGDLKERAEWVRAKAFGRLAEIAGEYLKKGSQVYVQGRMRTEEYTDKEGVKRWSTDIIIDKMVLLGGKDEGRGHGADRKPPERAEREPARQRDEPRRPQQQAFDPMLDDDIPF